MSKENIVKLETGSHKDLRLGRGRYDLIPLNVLNAIIRGLVAGWDSDAAVNKILHAIHRAREIQIDTYTITDEKELIEQKTDWLYEAINLFVAHELKVTWVDLTKRLAILFEKGAHKYHERDWEKGRPMSIFMNSALRHLIQFYNNEVDEDHGAAFVWNLLACIDTLNKKPDMANK